MKQKLLVKPSTLSGTINIPPSKSHTLRAILFAALANGTSKINNILPSPDTLAMVQACQSLGVDIIEKENFIEITGLNGQISKAEDVIQVGNSGLALRFLTAVCSLSSYPIVITGDESIRHQRPMAPLLNGLEQLGVNAISTKGDGFAPLIVQGPLKGGKVYINGADSQPISALLIAGCFAQEPIELFVENPGEKPWVNFTLEWLKRLGIEVKHDNYKYYSIKSGNFKPFDFSVPGDFSSAAFPIAAALVTQSEIFVQNLDSNDFQGDKELISIFKKMGGKISQRNDGILVQPTDILEGIEIDVNDFIDGLPILAVLGCYARGKTVIRNGKVARDKECDRIRCITTELRKMGAKIKEYEDGLVIENSKLSGAQVDGCHDHRLSMALAVAALGCNGESLICSANSIKKTYPTFVHDFQTLQARISVI